MADVVSGQPPPPEAGGISRLLRARTAWILTVTFVVALSAAVFSQLQAPSYSSTARVMVVPEVKTGGPPPQAPSMGTEKELAASDVVVSRAAAVLDVPVAELRAGMTVTVPVDANVLDITYSSRSPQEARSRARQLALAYVRYKDSQPIQTVPERATLITDAALPPAPAQPHTVLNIIAGVIVGLVLGFLTALVRDRLDDRVRGAADLEQRGLPVLTVVPPHDPATSDLVVLSAPDSPAAQAYGVLGEKVLLATRAANGVVAVTSAVEDEGKSSVAANLAIVLALGGKRVALVGADARSPSTGAVGDNWPGLLDVLSGRAPLSTALRPTRVSRLKLLGVGQVSAGAPARVVIWDWAYLSDALRKVVDVVVVEAGPVLSSAEGLRFIRDADAVVISVDQQCSTRSNVDRTALELGRAGATVLGGVLTAKTRRGRGPLGLLRRRRRYRQDQAAYEPRVDHPFAAPASIPADQQHLANVRPESGLWDARRGQQNGSRDISPQVLGESKE